MNEEEVQKTKEFVKRILVLENEIANLKEDIKEVKQDAKEDGILVKEINKAMSEVKKEIKASGNIAEKSLIDNFKDMIKEDSELFNSLSELIK